MKKSIWAIIAAKDEERHIFAVVKEARKYADVVLVVDDGSRDQTKARAEKARAMVLSHIVNMGKGVAIRTGCEYAIEKKADILILLDADGQHEPKDIPKFVDALSGCEIVFGARVRRKSMPIVLKFGNWVINSVAGILHGIHISDTQCGFRAMWSHTYPKVKWTASDYSMESEMLVNAGKKRLKYHEIPISTIYGDKYKGTTVVDGIKIVLDMIWWKLTRW